MQQSLTTCNCTQVERVVDLGVRLGRLGPNAFFGERAVLTRGENWPLLCSYFELFTSSPWGDQKSNLLIGCAVYICCLVLHDGHAIFRFDGCWLQVMA